MLISRAIWPNQLRLSDMDKAIYKKGMSDQIPRNPLFDSLNPSQYRAASHLDGPLVVFAGAGSGKTRVIISRIAHLIKIGVKPWRILVVTFTNKAATEIKERLEPLFEEQAKVHIATFHGAAARWLFEFAPHLGYKAQFSIFDEKDAEDVLKQVCSALFTQKLDKASIATYRGYIHQAKSMGMSPKDWEVFINLNPKRAPPISAHVYESYQKAMLSLNAMDFDDLMLNITLLQRSSPDIAEKIAGRYDYVMVDEFQDTNGVQFSILNSLVKFHQNLMVVGDDDQSIYSWRGAMPELIVQFKDHYPQATEIVLEQHYRCAPHILKAACSLISHNKHRVNKNLWTINPENAKVCIKRNYNDINEALDVATQIKAEESIFPLHEVAIFYRTNAQSRAIEEALVNLKLPYQIFGGIRFYDRAEIKDVLAFIRLAVNHDDDVAFARIANIPSRGIGAKAIEKLRELAYSLQMPLFKTLQNPQLWPDAAHKQLKKFMPLVAIMTEVKNIVCAPFDNQEPCGMRIKYLIEHIGYSEFITKKYPDKASEKHENLAELASALSVYGENKLSSQESFLISDWLTDIALVGAIDELPMRGISLMTMHMAKGLEFERVYIIGVEEGLVPHKNSIDDEKKVEEERRLLYVGMTRAKKSLSLHFCERRRLYQDIVLSDPSRFLEELPRDDLTLVGSHQQESDEPRYEMLEEEFTPFQPGDIVIHPVYGQGKVVARKESFGRMKVIVHFPVHGKLLMPIEAIAPMRSYKGI